MAQTVILLPAVYLRLALAFTAGSLALAGWMAYAVAGSARVILTLHDRERETSMVVPIGAGSGADDERVQGLVIQKMVTGEADGTASGSRTKTSETVGSVKIINEHTKPQPLVATTRLLAGDGTLLRLKSGVQVPAGGSVMAVVYPDAPAAFRELPPTHLTLPGLWAPLQAKIYAVSESPLQAGGTEIPVVTTQDVDRAAKALEERLYQEAVTAINAQLSPEQAIYTQLVESETTERRMDGGAGAEQATFTVRLKLAVVSVAFDEAELLTLVRRNLAATMPPGQTMVHLDVDDLRYTVQSRDVAGGMAMVAVTAKGQLGLRPDSQWLSPAALAGKSRAEIERFYAPLDTVKSVAVYFRPAWQTQAPRSASRIQIIVE